LDQDTPRSLQPLPQNLQTPHPTVKDPDRVADPSTLRRWFHHLDFSRPSFSALRRTMLAVSA
jgi:hypothetical protein